MDGVKYKLMEEKIVSPIDYNKNDKDLLRSFEISEKIHEKFMKKLRGSLRVKAEKERYELMMYSKLNLQLEKSPHLASNKDHIINIKIKFRL